MTLRALLVDDDRFMRQIQSAILAKSGFEVSLAASGFEALDILQADSFDVVFMDMQMPEMDGLESTKKIRSKGIAVPIIAVTGNNCEMARQNCFQVGMNGFLCKPINPSAVQAEVDMALR